MTPSLIYSSAFYTPHISLTSPQDLQSTQPCITYINAAFLPRNLSLHKLRHPRTFLLYFPGCFPFSCIHYFYFLYKLFSPLL